MTTSEIKKQHYGASAGDEAKYTKMFEKLDTENGYLSGKRAVVLLGKSGVPQETLAKVWMLADSDVDGRLSVKEFCMAMHLIGCVRKGLPLPELLTMEKPKKGKKQSHHAATKPNEAEENNGILSVKSPKRRSRLASLVEPQQDAGVSGTSTSKVHKPKGCHGGIRDSPDPCFVNQNESAEELAPQEVAPAVSNAQGSSRLAVVRSTNSTELESTQRASNEEKEKPDERIHGKEGMVNEKLGTSRKEAAGRREHREPSRKRRPNLRQLDAKDVDAVFAEGPGAINSLRDVQSWRVLVMGLQRLSGKDMARQIPVKSRPRRRHTLPLAAKGELARTQDFLPGRGRRTSLLVTAYEPAALFLKQRAERRSTREVDLEKDTANAAEKWNLKPLLDKAERGSNGETDGEQTDDPRGNLSVAGLPLLDEDIDVIAHLLRQNHAFKRLDLSRCFLSEKQFVLLAQALAWNSRIEELFLQECIFTGARTAALADVLTVNSHIHSIDVRGCKGLDEKDIQLILGAARKRGNLLNFNGMDLADLRAEGSTELNLSGWGLGYVEAVVVADCLRTRPDGLRRVDLHGNLLSTEAFETLMAALRKQSQLRSLDLRHNMVDERTLPDIAELLRRNPSLASVNLTNNRISCTEFEHYGLDLMRLLSSNNVVTVFDVEENNVSPKMLTIISEKLAANRAVRRDMTFVDCLQLKYPRIAPRPVLADPRRLHLEEVDVPFMVQEGIPAMQTTVHTEQAAILTLDGTKPGIPLDLFFVQQCSVDVAVGYPRRVG